ncbi:inorganic pyrophosphatase [Wohlfahrtiimonas chitiniclastica]|uniref:inorganic diphosphatase n=1 Tax=Wohlfahrtiimonas chitiniclastica TaxID=400946 RepID=UPI000B99A933|nr:inorganic diphosphatase [Wohlfahrtiimonas chitiniclastica]OYQ89499.1 inorganic pyrophosphatase [Wohlfahrtiimonas chitiniclastica]
MSFNSIPAAKDLNKITEDFNCIIEIPAESDPVKYEIEDDLVWVDRFVGTNMRYPANYGYIPQTLCDDGDALDVLVVTPFPLIHGCVVRARPLGVLNMTDESGGDAKLVAVPVSKLCPMYDNIQSIDDLPELLVKQIEFFFQNYKGLEKGKWVKLDGFGTKEAAEKEILKSLEMFNSKK